MKTQIARILLRIAVFLMFFCCALPLLTSGFLPSLLPGLYSGLLPELLGAETFGAWLWGAPAFSLYLVIALFFGGCCVLVGDRRLWTGWCLMLTASLLLAIPLVLRMTSIVLQPFPGLLGLLDDNVSLVMVGWCILVSAIGLCLKCLHREDILKKPEKEDA